jgi:hypothetical protein
LKRDKCCGNDHNGFIKEKKSAKRCRVPKAVANEPGQVAHGWSGLAKPIATRIAMSVFTGATQSINLAQVTPADLSFIPSRKSI